MVLLILYLLLALVVSFYCSILEAVLLSVTPSYIESRMNSGKEWPRKLLNMKKDVDRPLAAILSLNTIAHTIGAAGVGAQAAVVFQNVPVGIVSAVLTLLILVFSELIPKTLGAQYWRSLGLFTTRSLQVLLVIMYPLVLIAKFITGIFRKEEQASVERNEVVALAEIGLREGVFTKSEAQIMTNIIGLRSICVHDIMTPRTVMVAAAEDMTVDSFRKEEGFYRFSRIPLYHGSKDDITGFIHKLDLLGEKGGVAPVGSVLLKEIKREIAVVNEEMDIYELYSYLIRENTHIALVKGEFGGTAGIVTMEDVIETLLGLEIMDEFDKTADLRQYARERWKERAERLGLKKIDDSTQSKDN